MMCKAFAGIGTVIIALTLSIAPGSLGQTQRSAIKITAPVWHTGEWWRVRVPLIESNIGADQALPATARYVRDSATAFTVYRYQVIGRQTLTYEEQDGPKHIGQAVPPEMCWVVSVTPEGQRERESAGFYRMFFRADDLSLRQIHLIVGSVQKPRIGWFMYRSTFVNDDGVRPVVVVDRGPAQFGQGNELILDCPKFPLDASVNSRGSQSLDRQEHQQIFPQSVVAADIPIAGTRRPGLCVTIGRQAAQVSVQNWLPGYPWWVSSKCGGLHRSRLLETSDGGPVN